MRHSYKVKDGRSNRPEGTMTIGDWEINEIGMIMHLKCNQPSASWSFNHRCWTLNPGWDKGGRYIEVVVPEMVQTLSKIAYEAWNPK